MSILEKLKIGVVTKSPEETEKLAIELSKEIPVDSIITLSGELGVGKTVFVKGLAKAWGIEETVTSPTFNIFTVYNGVRNLVHFDAYRLTDPSQIETLMIEDFLESPYCLAVEWPEKTGSWLPDDCIKLNFSIIGEGKHHFILE